MGKSYKDAKIVHKSIFVFGFNRFTHSVYVIHLPSENSKINGYGNIMITI